MQKETILCVDDDPIQLGLLRNTLQNDYTLVFAHNGAEAMAAVLKHNPALILLDVQMPDMNGFEVSHKLRINLKTAHIPIIFVTSLVDEMYENRGFDLGCVDYITKPIFPRILLARVRTHLSLSQASRLEASYRETICMLNIIGTYHENNMGKHIWRVAAYSHLLAQTIGWDENRAALMEMAATMHDIGKIGVSDIIIQKPDKLTDEEWVIMKQHSRIGYDILSKISTPLFQLAAEIALNHHERWDGSGYPNGLVGEEIPESARIVAIADVFDTLSMPLSYKKAWSMESIFLTIQESAGSQFDKKLVTAFMDILPQILELKTKCDNLSPPEIFMRDR